MLFTRNLLSAIAKSHANFMKERNGYAANSTYKPSGSASEISVSANRNGLVLKVYNPVHPMATRGVVTLTVNTNYETDPILAVRSYSVCSIANDKILTPSDMCKSLSESLNLASKICELLSKDAYQSSKFVETIIKSSNIKPKLDHSCGNVIKVPKIELGKKLKVA